MKRRDFIKQSIASGAYISAHSFLSCTASEDRLNILVLGGTNFVGPAIVSAAQRSGHRVTLFNRGITNPQLFPEIPLIKGDRTKGIQAYDGLRNKEWDVIIDVWPEKSSLVIEAARALKDQTSHYIFISSIAVYKNFQEVGLHEESEVVNFTLPEDEWGYAEEKLIAENFVRNQFDQYTIIRPGPVKGWRDPALDLLYWCIKLNRDSMILAPGSGMDPLQFIDCNDVGKFAIMAAEKNSIGVYNCTGPLKKPLIWKDFLALAKQHFGSKTELVWADEEFLKRNKIASFSDLPLWAPLSEDKGFMQISNKKLQQTGFEFSRVTDTLDDCMKWHQDYLDPDLRFGTTEIEIGLDKSIELAMIEKLKSSW